MHRRSDWLPALAVLLALLAPARTAHGAEDTAAPAGPEAPKAMVEVDPPWTTTQAEEQLGGETVALWQDGNLLHVLCRAGAESVRLGGGIQEPMQRLGESDLWALSLRIQNLSKAVISYACAPAGQPYPAKEKHQTWRGPKAPPEPERAEELDGTLTTMAIQSRALEELRTVTIYRPPKSGERPLPVVYLADGQMVNDFAHVLEPAIRSGRLPPLLLVGAHSATYDGDFRQDYDPAKDRRSLDYLAGYADDLPESVDPAAAKRFSRHREFFLQELRELAEKRFGASRKRQDRVIFGVSNGAAFAVVTSIEKPRQFGGAIVLSAGWSPTLKRPATACGQRCPQLYLSAGLLEERFYSTTSRWATKLEDWASRLHFRPDRVSGHDPRMWEEELLAGLEWYFAAE